MPLEAYKRGPTWWAKGRIELNGRPISEYIRKSTGASTEAGARDWIREEEARTIRRHLVGEEADLTFAEACTLYNAKPATAKFLLKILDHIAEMPVREINPKFARELAPKMYPKASTDTWRRQVLTPISAVINNAHALNRCGPIRMKAYSTQERLDQDARRGKQSRKERQAGSWEWLRAFQSEANPYLGALAEFMFETGARISQAIALRPDDLDFARRRVWLQSSKGHDAQWVAISQEMVVTLANLTPRQPYSRDRMKRLKARVFGYADRSGPRTAWKSACKRAGIPHLSPHAAGRHGFYTELRVRRGVDGVTAAAAGRWKDPALPDRIYAHAETAEEEIRRIIRSGDVQTDSAKPIKSLKKKG